MKLFVKSFERKSYGVIWKSLEIFIIIKYILEILEEPPLSLFVNLQMWRMWKNIGRK